MLGYEKLVVLYDGPVKSTHNKMGMSCIRHYPDRVVGIVSIPDAGKSLKQFYPHQRDLPIFGSINEALQFNPDAILTGDMPSGGRCSYKLMQQIHQGVRYGLSVINGLHDQLKPQFELSHAGQKIIDLRSPDPSYFVKSQGKAVTLHNKRVLTVGTDMAVGKMTTAFTLHQHALKLDIASRFLATGQVGMALADNEGVAVDSVPLDFAGGAIEKLVTDHPAPLQFIEGQGAINNPASAATLALIRGSMPTHLILCHRLSLEGYLKDFRHIPIPDLNYLAELYIAMAHVDHTLQDPPVLAGVCINTANTDIPYDTIQRYCDQLASELNVPVFDPFQSPDNCQALIQNL